LVEVLLHAAARAATFLIFSSHTGCFLFLGRGLRRPLCFNLMQSRRLLLCVEKMFGRDFLFQSFAVTQTASMPFARMCKRYIAFILMQPYGLRLAEKQIPLVVISILCSHTDCFGNDTQRLHFVHDVALRILPFLCAVIIVCC
jgi:hypothetical protein